MSNEMKLKEIDPDVDYVNQFIKRYAYDGNQNLDAVSVILDEFKELFNSVERKDGKILANPFDDYHYLAQIIHNFLDYSELTNLVDNVLHDYDISEMSRDYFLAYYLGRGFSPQQLYDIPDGDLAKLAQNLDWDEKEGLAITLLYGILDSALNPEQSVIDLDKLK